jgi:D-arginine utilization repressor
MKTELKKSIPIAEAFTRLLHPFAEVVIHDLAKGKIEAIYNPFSQRSVGSDSFLSHADFTSNSTKDVIGPYEKLNYDGRQIKSISIVLRDKLNKVIGFLCVNMDVSVFYNYKNTLDLFLSNNEKITPNTKQILFKDDLYEQINIFVQSYCRKKFLSIGTLSKKDKQNLILSLIKEGAFNGKNATTYIAKILNTSRATIYNYIKKIKFDNQINTL